MADTRGLDGLDPYDLHDVECARIGARFDGLDEAGWAAPSGCAGWSRRDLLGHLVAIEEYFGACLAGTVSELIERYVAGGATSLDEANDAAVAARRECHTADLVAEWKDANARNRAGYRAADGTDIDTTVGAYPCRWQAFHAAFEWAVHADDLHAHVHDADRPARTAWMAQVARFALTEVKDSVDVEIDEDAGTVTVTQGDARVDTDLAGFVNGVSGRAPDGAFTPDEATLLSPGY